MKKERHQQLARGNKRQNKEALFSYCRFCKTFHKKNIFLGVYKGPPILGVDGKGERGGELGGGGIFYVFVYFPCSIKIEKTWIFYMYPSKCYT